MFNSLFHFGSNNPSINAALSNTTAPKEIVRGCIAQLQSQVLRKDKELKDMLNEIVISLPPDDEDHYIDDICIDQKFMALKAACERRNQPKLVQASLSVIDKLVSADLLVGSEYWSEKTTPPVEVDESQSDPMTPDMQKKTSLRIVMDVVVETVFKSVQDASPDDEETHLLAIRCILSCILSRHRLVHGVSLMTCVRTCYLINKDSKSITAQSTATSALTQILQTLNDRLDEVCNKPKENNAPVIGDWASGYARNILNKTVLLTDPDNESNDNRGRIGWCAVCGEPADYYCRKARDPVCSMICKQTNLHRMNIVTNLHRVITLSTNRINKKTVEYKDVITVFKSLCRLSTYRGGDSLSSQAVIKSTRLSLELIASILDSSKTTLFSDLGFIDVIKTCLMECLLTNSVSPVPGIFNVALDIFSYLLSCVFKHEMLYEIGLFVHQVLVYIIESPNSPDSHKTKAIGIIASMDCDLILNLFQRFDCSMDQKNVVELTLSALIKQQNCGTLPAEALNAIIKSLSDFVVAQHPHAADLPSEAYIPPSEIATVMGSASVAEPVEVPTIVAIPSQGKQRKLLLQEGIDLFKQKPSKGIDFFVINGFIDSMEPKQIAKAFMEMPGLDKTAIGDFIGENKSLNLECLYELVDLMTFTDLELDQALRKFLATFRLPGEAQKIDRIMEKFADKFTRDNPNRYANADAAYVLSFAVIMLNTDLHSPQIKKKMTIEEFVKLGKGINTEIEISQPELERLYRNIQQDEIKMNDLNPTAVMTTVSNGPSSSTDEATMQRKRFEMFMKETEQVIQRSRETLTTQRREKRTISSDTLISSDQDVKDIIIIMHAGLADAFKTVLAKPVPSLEDQMAAYETLVSETILSISRLISLAILFDLEAVKTELFNVLIEIAIVDITKYPIEHKTTEAMRTILHLAGNQGNGLGQSWLSVVKLISLIDKLSLVAATKLQPVSNSREPSLASGGFAIGRVFLGYAPNVTVPGYQGYSELERVNADITLATIDYAAIDLIFTRSVSLNPVNIVNLTAGLVEVSASELAESPPRLFSCQRLVELADYNMSRQIRIVWSKIWNLIAPCFVRIATTTSSDNVSSMFAIDSLRQLAFKFLTKMELGNYHFQNEFMRPFSVIMATSMSSQDMVLSVMDSLVKQVATNLKSGWLSVFSVIAIACKSQSNQSLLDNATWLLAEINMNAYSVALLKGETFREYMQCLILLLGNEKADSRAIDFGFTAIANHMQRLDDKIVDISETTSHWLSITRGLASLLTDRKDAVRDQARTVLFDTILNNNVASIDADTVQIMLRAVLIPWMDDLVHSIGDTVSIDFGIMLVGETSNAFNKAIETNFTTVYSRFVFEIFNYNSLLVLNERNEKFGAIGLDNVRKLVGLVTAIRNRPDQVIEGLTKLVSGTIPRVLLENTNVTTITSLPFSPDRVLCLCSTHLSVIQLVGDFVAAQIDFNQQSWTGICHIIDSLEQSKQFAVRFNSEIALREKLKNLGFMRDLRQLPGLLKQERAALSVSLKILFLVEKNVDKFDNVDICRERLGDVCSEVVNTYVAKETRVSSITRDTLIDEIEREVNGLVPIIASVIVGSGFGDMNDHEFNKNKGWIFDVLVKLIHVNNVSIRQEVASVLSKKFKPDIRQ